MTREVPANIEAEQALLGAILVNNAAYFVVEGLVQAQHFYEPIHRQIFEVAADLIKLNKTANPVTMKVFLPSEQTIGNLTVGRYLALLAAEAVTILGAPDYAMAIRDMASRRQMISIGQSMIDRAIGADANSDPWSMISEAESSLNELTDSLGGLSDTTVTMGDSFTKVVSGMEETLNGATPQGMLTGIDAVDQLTGPWRPGQQIIIGSATKMGKSSLSMQAAIGIAKYGPVFVYSGEMSAEELTMREIARRTGIPAEAQAEGRMTRAQLSLVRSFKSEISALPIVIEERRMTLEQMHQATRAMKRKRGLVGVFVDQITLLAWGREHSRTDSWTKAEIATGYLKSMYRDLDVPGVSISQLKKNTFVRNFGRERQTGDAFRKSLQVAINQRPNYADLMGSIEQHSDHVIMPYNPLPILAGMEPPEETEEWFIWEEMMRKCDGRAEIILALSRSKKFPQRRSVEWHGETTSFGRPIIGKQEVLFENL